MAAPQHRKEIAGLGRSGQQPCRSHGLGRINSIPEGHDWVGHPVPSRAHQPHGLHNERGVTVSIVTNCIVELANPSVEGILGIFDQFAQPPVRPPSTTGAATAAQAEGGSAAPMLPMQQPTVGGEDFSFMLDAKQGHDVMLRAGKTGNDLQVHHPLHDLHDDILPAGASWEATLAEQVLSRAAQ